MKINLRVAASSHRLADPAFAFLAATLPTLAYADRYGIDEAMKDAGGGGSGLLYLLLGGATGTAIGYALGWLYNAIRDEDKEIAPGGCGVLGMFIGAFCFPFIYVALTK